METDRNLSSGPHEDIDAVLARCKKAGITVTALRRQVLDIVLSVTGVIKAYEVLSLMQQQNKAPVAPPTVYRTLDFWAENGVLHKIAAVNGYILCRHVRHNCNNNFTGRPGGHHSGFVLVCTQCGAVDEQNMSAQWQTLNETLADSGFTLNDEHIVLTGICRQCRKKTESLPST